MNIDGGVGGGVDTWIWACDGEKSPQQIAYARQIPITSR